MSATRRGRSGEKSKRSKKRSQPLSELGHAACEYAREGFHVFPCAERYAKVRAEAENRVRESTARRTVELMA